MKRQKIAAGCLAAVMLLGLSFWAGTRTQPWEIPALPSTDDVLQMEETAFADANVLKFACPFSRGSFQSQVLQKFCDFLNQKFAPEIYIQFYDGGELGPEWDTMDALQNQRLEMCAVSTANLAYIDESAAVPYTSPFGITTPEEFLELMASDVTCNIEERLEHKGIYSLGSFYNGLRYIWSKEPIQTVKDLSKIRLRVPPMPYFENSFQGVVQSTLSTNTSEILVNLKSGTIDAYEQAVSEVIETELYQYTPYCLKLGHYVSFTTILVSQEVMDMFDEEQIQELYDCAEAAIVFAQLLYGSLNGTWERDLSLMGITFSTLPQRDYEAVKAQMRKNFTDTLPEMFATD